MSEDDGDLEWPIGHPVPAADGFEGEGRLAILAATALQDLALRADLFRAPLRQAAVVCAVPAPGRIARGLDLVSDRRRREIRATVAAAPGLEPALLDRVFQLADVPIDVRSREVRDAGHAGVAHGLRDGVDGVQSGRLRHAVVGGVDSLLDGSTLEWLDDTERLKAPGRPLGLQPGEAAAFLLVERADAARTAGRMPLARVVGTATGEEPAALLDACTPLGRGLASTVLGLPGRVLETAGWILSDHNGEAYRALEWGHALLRLGARAPQIREAPVTYPAIAFGDTGTASGAVACCLAIEAFARGWAPANGAVVLSTGEGRERGAIALTRC